MSYEPGSASRNHKRKRHEEQMKRDGRCPLCPPHGKENRTSRKPTKKKRKPWKRG